MSLPKQKYLILFLITYLTNNIPNDKRYRFNIPTVLISFINILKMASNKCIEVALLKQFLSTKFFRQIKNLWDKSICRILPDKTYTKKNKKYLYNKEPRKI